MSGANDLCQNCGLCCDGTLFHNFNIQKEEYHLFSPKNIDSFGNVSQPCEHFDSCGDCKIYKNRPRVCFKYKCSVINSFEQGNLSFDDSLKHIQFMKNNKNNKSKIWEFLHSLNDLNKKK
tara:strand:- start:6449 stop:6808 length:360 start_codon:yes stop_codon:yes gene_type:complete